MDLKDGRITVNQVLRNPQAMAVLQRELPELAGSPLLRMAGGMSLNQGDTRSAEGHIRACLQTRGRMYLPRVCFVLQWGKGWRKGAGGMDRLTHPDGPGLIAPGSEEEAFEKLRRLENMTDALRAEQEELAAELARLKADNQTKTYRFREKMAKKYANATVLDALALYDLV